MLLNALSVLSLNIPMLIAGLIPIEKSTATEDNASTDVVCPSRCCCVLLTTLALILLGSVFKYL
jgi:hypothetical protein